MAGIVANLSVEQPLLQDDYSSREPGERSRRRRSKGSKKSKKGKRKPQSKRVVNSTPKRSPIAEAMGVR